MALREKEVRAELGKGSLRKLIAQVESKLNSGRERFMKKVPLVPIVENIQISRVPRQRGKTETGECPVYSGEEYVSVSLETDDAETEGVVEIAAKVRFPEKGAT